VAIAQEWGYPTALQEMKSQKFPKENGDSLTCSCHVDFLCRNTFASSNAGHSLEPKHAVALNSCHGLHTAFGSKPFEKLIALNQMAIASGCSHLSFLRWHFCRINPIKN